MEEAIDARGWSRASRVRRRRGLAADQPGQPIRRAALCPAGEAASVRESGERKETLSPTTTAATPPLILFTKRGDSEEEKSCGATTRRQCKSLCRSKCQCVGCASMFALRLQWHSCLIRPALDDEHYWRPDVAVAVFNIRDIMSTVTLNPSCCFAY
uniref:Uncharacterized protein n=1 Tax=Plectus sambesii TaxID=2011161 RepID=A0A914XI15_9BILA